MTSERVRNRIKQIRLSKGWSQDMAAKAIGVTQNTYSRMETSASRISVDQLFQFCEAFEVDMLTLLSDEPFKIEI
jgi:transcriptional regulator with XRE-family HTH domain